MPVLRNLVVRDDSSSRGSTMTPTMMNLLIAMVILLIVAIILVAALLVLRSYRRSRNQKYPTQHPLHPGNYPKASKHRRLTISATPYRRSSNNQSDIHVYNEKQTLIEAAASPPQSPIPEIRITFPEEEDAGGKRQSGRVVVVRISEQGGLGLEPYKEEHLPPYQSTDSGRFESLDLDRIGGLREVERHARRS